MGDSDEITALVHRYAELLDGGDIEGVVELFADADWRSDATGEVRRGQEQIKAVYDRVILYDDGTPKTRHVMTNLVIDLVDGASVATGRCTSPSCRGSTRGHRSRPSSPGVTTISTGERPDGWQFAERLFIADLLGDQSRHFG